jgi:hypothetical protein
MMTILYTYRRQRISHTLLYIYFEGFVENNRRRRKEKELEMDKKTSRNKKERRRYVEREKRGVIKCSIQYLLLYLRLLFPYCKRKTLKREETWHWLCIYSLVF